MSMKEQGSEFKSRVVVYNPETTEETMKTLQKPDGQATWMQVLLALMQESRRRREHAKS